MQKLIIFSNYLYLEVTGVRVYISIYLHSSVCIIAPPVTERFCFPIGRQYVLGSFLGRSCRHSPSLFSVVFSETRVNVD